MAQVYILQSRSNGRFYIGSTTELQLKSWKSHQAIKQLIESRVAG